MTAITALPATDTRPDQIRRRITGTAAEVSVALAMVRDSGHLVAATAPRQISATDQRVTMLVTLRRIPALTPVVASASPRSRWVKPLAIGGTAAGVLAVLGYVLSVLLRQAVHAVAGLAPVGIGLAVIVVLVLVFAGRRKGVCVGLHCAGCGH